MIIVIMWAWFGPHAVLSALQQWLSALRVHFRPYGRADNEPGGLTTVAVGPTIQHVGPPQSRYCYMNRAISTGTAQSPPNAEFATRRGTNGTRHVPVICPVRYLPLPSPPWPLPGNPQLPGSRWPVKLLGARWPASGVGPHGQHPRAP